MGKSQTKRLREATKRFGREDWNRLASARANLSVLVHARKVEAGLISPATAVARPANTGRVLVKRYSTSLTYQENEDKFGRAR
jgi:hypothetical protein